MANDITIVVEASLGDSLIKLGAAKEAVKSLGDENARLSVSTDKNTESQGKLSRALGFVTGNWKILVPAMTAAGVALLGFTGNMGALLPLVPVLTALLAGLIAPFTTLAAIMVGFIPPITLIAGLLGALGLGFVLAGKRAADGGGSLSKFSDMVATLGSMFHKTTDILAHTFLPYLLQLGHAAETALLYFDKLAKMSLGDALRSLSTQGVGMLTKFLEGIGHVIGKPIRLAFEIAFGPQGSTIRNAMLKIWTQITDFFTKPPSTGGKSIQSMVADWFGRQDFTAVGMRWAIELAGAFVGALGSAIKKMLSSRGGLMILGGVNAGALIGAYLGGPMGAALGAAIGLAAGVALNHYWPRIRQAGINAFHAVENAAKAALGPTLWNAIVSRAQTFWNWLKGIGHVIAGTIYPAVRLVWDKLGGWHTVLVIVVGVIRIIAAALITVADFVTSVYNRLHNVLSAVATLAGIVGGTLLGAFNAVAGVVSSIVGGIQSAIGAAQSLASALSAGGGKGGVVAQGASGYVPGSNTGGGTGGGSGKVVVMNVHLHNGTFSDAASRRREAEATGAHLLRIWAQASGTI